MKFTIASRNPGKIAEIERIIRESVPAIRIVPLPLETEFPPEGDDYLENAVTKARTAMAATGAPAVADDSGLEVDALNGAPGIRSARYESSDERRIARMLEELAHVATTSHRTARFRCLAAAAFADGTILHAEGVWEGRILFEPRGKAGFGYDPIFFEPAAGKSAAEMSAADKQLRSHRGIAFRRLAALISRWIRLS